MFNGASSCSPLPAPLPAPAAAAAAGTGASTPSLTWHAACSQGYTTSQKRRAKAPRKSARASACCMHAGEHGQEGQKKEDQIFQDVVPYHIFQDVVQEPSRGQEEPAYTKDRVVRDAACSQDALHVASCRPSVTCHTQCWSGQQARGRVEYRATRDRQTRRSLATTVALQHTAVAAHSNAACGGHQGEDLGWRGRRQR